MTRCEVAVVGLGVMGGNLALNLADRGFKVAVFNRTSTRTKEFLGKVPRDVTLTPAYSIGDFVGNLETPRKIILMVTAGEALDQTISQLAPFLMRGDIVMDGGNSFFKDTERRIRDLSSKEIAFMGLGISGGEKGAREGPCIMAGGAREGYDQTSRILEKIAAKGDHGVSCSYVGQEGAGHYVKMVHNGIEYAMIQLIAEAYDAMMTALKLEPDRIRRIFEEWNTGGSGSYLIEIASKVVGRVDEETKKPLLDLIVDRAGQKGTGRWASQNAMDLGVPIPTIDAAVSARNLSSLREERLRAANILGSAVKRVDDEFIDLLEDALYCANIVSFAQGFSLIREASSRYHYSTNLGEVARIWKAGCIIRSKLLTPIQGAFERNLDLPNLLLDERFALDLRRLEDRWRRAVLKLKEVRLSCPALSSSLDYYDGYSRQRLPAYMVQAMRDAFGAHGYERVDKPGDFHTDWFAG